MLGAADGERVLTDLRHIAELLRRRHGAERLGVAPWAPGCGRGSPRPAPTSREDRTRRLDADAAAVQVLTVHRGKGLEFPMVYVPFCGTGRGLPDDPLPVFPTRPTATAARSTSAVARARLRGPPRPPTGGAGRDLRLPTSR